MGVYKKSFGPWIFKVKGNEVGLIKKVF